MQPDTQFYETGSNLNLSCSAVSVPPAIFRWFRNGEQLSETRPQLRLVNIQANQSGNYSCQAFNEKTLRYDTSQMLAVDILGRQIQNY